MVALGQGVCFDHGPFIMGCSSWGVHHRSSWGVHHGVAVNSNLRRSPPPPPCQLQAFEQVLAIHPEWRGKLVLVQVTSAARCVRIAAPAAGHYWWRRMPGGLCTPCFAAPGARICRSCCIRGWMLARRCPPQCPDVAPLMTCCSAPGKDVEELQRFVLDLVEAINAKYRQPG